SSPHSTTRCKVGQASRLPSSDASPSGPGDHFCSIQRNQLSGQAGATPALLFTAYLRLSQFDRFDMSVERPRQPVAACLRNSRGDIPTRFLKTRLKCVSD